MAAVLRPFRGLRRQGSTAIIQDWIAPSDGSRPGVDSLVDPLAEPGDRSRFIRYARSAALLAQMRTSGELAADETPSCHHLVFGESKTSSWAGLIRLNDLPATELPPSVRDERLRLLEATRTHFELPSIECDSLVLNESEVKIDGLQISHGAVQIEAARELYDEVKARRPDGAEAWIPVAVRETGERLVFNGEGASPLLTKRLAQSSDGQEIWLKNGEKRMIGPFSDGLLAQRVNGTREDVLQELIQMTLDILGPEIVDLAWSRPASAAEALRAVLDGQAEGAYLLPADLLTGDSCALAFAEPLPRGLVMWSMKDF